MFAVVLRHIRHWLIAVALVVGVPFALLQSCRHLWMSGACSYEVFENTQRVAGFDVEISESDCWHSPVMSVFISRPGGGKRVRLFQYSRDIPTYNPNADPLPVITEIDEHTIQILLARAGTLDCGRVYWRGLTIRYDIGPVRYPSPNRDRVPECWE